MGGPDRAAPVIVGRVRNAHGIRGEVAVELFTDAPEAVFASGRRVLAGTADGELPPANAHGPRELHVRRASPHKGGLIVAFEEIADRTAAELWRGRYLLVPGEELPPPEEDEVYYHDFVGMRVERAGGAEVGEVVGFYELPQGLTLEVRAGRGTVLLPYRPELVARLDEERRALVLTGLAEGLLE